MAYFPGLGPSYLPLLKIPLVITSSALGAAAMTPPRPPVATTDRKKYGDRADPLGSWFIRRFAVPTNKCIFWMNAAAETLAILCVQLPSPGGDAVLSLITRRPETASNIRFTPIWLAGAVMSLTGSLIRFACARTLGRFFTWEMSLQRDQHLVTSGPYSIVRHPSYTGSWLLSIGTILMHLGPGGWLYECVGGGQISNGLMTAWGIWHVAVPVLLTMRVSREDKVLRKEFGAEWEAYARRTPYRLVPYLY